MCWQVASWLQRCALRCAAWFLQDMEYSSNKPIFSWSCRIDSCIESPSSSLGRLERIQCRVRGGKWPVNRSCSMVTQIIRLATYYCCAPCHCSWSDCRYSPDLGVPGWPTLLHRGERCFAHQNSFQDLQSHSQLCIHNDTRYLPALAVSSCRKWSN